MARKKAVKKVGGATKEVSKLDYHLEVSFNDVVYKGDASSLEDALVGFVKSSVFPQGTKTKVVFKFGKGTQEATRVLPPMLARRIFSKISLKPVALQILANRLTSQLE